MSESRPGLHRKHAKECSGAAISPILRYHIVITNPFHVARDTIGIISVVMWDNGG